MKGFVVDVTDDSPSERTIGSSFVDPIEVRAFRDTGKSSSQKEIGWSGVHPLD